MNNYGFVFLLDRHSSRLTSHSNLQRLEFVKCLTLLLLYLLDRFDQCHRRVQFVSWACQCLDIPIFQSFQVSILCKVMAEDDMFAGDSDDADVVQEAPKSKQGKKRRRESSAGSDSSAKSKPKGGKGKAKAKAKEHRPHHKKKGSKKGALEPCKAGYRRCIECGVEKLLGMFKPASAICNSPCYRMLENIKRACVKDSREDYWEKIKNDPAEKKKAMRWYQLKCPPKEEGSITRQKAFPVAQHDVIVLGGFGDSSKVH